MKNMDDNKDGKTIHQIVVDALELICREDGCQMDSQLRQGRAILAFAANFKSYWNSDAYKALAVQSMENLTHCHRCYSDRQLRNLGAFSRIYDEMEKVFGSAPQVSFTHYVAVNVKGLELEIKHSLLCRAKQEKWSVSKLEEEVRKALKKPENVMSCDSLRDLLISTVGAVVGSLTELSGLIPKEHPLSVDQLTSLLKLNNAIEVYQAAYKKETPGTPYTDKGLDADEPIANGEQVISVTWGSDNGQVAASTEKDASDRVEQKVVYELSKYSEG
jgi:hypothetical protein